MFRTYQCGTRNEVEDVTPLVVRTLASNYQVELHNIFAQCDTALLDLGCSTDLARKLQVEYTYLMPLWPRYYL